MGLGKSHKWLLHPIPSEFPYIWGKFYFMFCQCAFLHLYKTLVFFIYTLQKVSTNLGDFVRKSYANWVIRWIIYAHFLCFRFFNAAYHFQVSGLFSCWRCWATVASSLFSSSAEAKWTCQGEASAGIFKQSMGAKNRVGIGQSYRPARLHAWRNWFLGMNSWAP